jgi:PKD repeat protein
MKITMAQLMRTLLTTSALACLMQAHLAHATALYDITDKHLFTVSAEHAPFVENEGPEQAFDASLNSKFLSKESTSWLKLAFNNTHAIKGYTITSALDAPARDPKHWQVSTSLDGKTWQVIDNVENAHFSKRAQTRRFEIAAPVNARFIRFALSQEGKTQWGDSYLQLADIGVLAETEQPLANFSSSAEVVMLGDSLTLTDTSENAPTKHHWQVPNAQVTQHGKQAVVRFNKAGKYDVSLSVTNEFGSDTIRKANAIKVLNPDKPWQGLNMPKVIVKIEDNHSAGSKRLQALMPNIEAEINQVTAKLVPMLYKNFTQVPEFEQITFTLKWMDTLAYRAGDYSNMEIAFSSKYITEKLANQADEQVKYELLGVLWHELTHGYQLFPTNGHEHPEESHAFIEGMADLIRIQAGFHKTRSPKPSPSWLGGYTNTGFFLAWLSEQHPDFAYQFNATAHQLENWRFASAIEAVTNKPLNELWQAYQNSLL